MRKVSLFSRVPGGNTDRAQMKTSNQTFYKTKSSNMYTIKPLLILKVLSKADDYKKAHHVREMVFGQILLYGFGP